MKTKLAESYVVRLDGLGTFRAVLKSVGATDVQKFSTSSNIYGVNVNFQAERKSDPVTGAFTKPLLSGVRMSETPKNDIGIEKA